ncbi:dynein axonemal light chain 1-like [Phlebotomus argentipes]|uniref:dynein axonemal light chain 1-like n=1 Tax=Phlebotomus argentipes TaxID=94469 RepID=UPI002893579D|nr:dynein axonemal light chain 1-like [Phlebotomus argentipes]
MTSIAKALSLWEEENDTAAEEGREIGLQFQWPPIQQMDDNLSKLVSCEMLSLSTNCIEKVAGLQGMKNLRILSLGRNNISSLAGLEVVAETLEELWMSYNSLQQLTGLELLVKLRVFHVANNLIRNWSEVDKIANHKNLEELVFAGNPLVEDIEEEEEYFEMMKKRLPNIKKLDGEPIVRLEEI